MAKFTKGQSGNPAGKPLGAKDKRTELRELLQPHSQQLLQKVVDLALSGDLSALKMCLDRICPTLKPIAEPVKADIQAGATLAEQGAALYQAAARGEIGIDEAGGLMSVLAAQCRIVELTEIERRLSELEGCQGGKK